MADFERAFERSAELDRARGKNLRREAVVRTHVRQRERFVQGQFRRYVILVVTLLATVIGVSWAMFETLAWLMA